MRPKRTDFTIVDAFFNCVNNGLRIEREEIARWLDVVPRMLYRYEHHQNYPDPNTLERMLDLLPKEIRNKLYLKFTKK